jgi:hypothetical protein
MSKFCLKCSSVKKSSRPKKKKHSLCSAKNNFWVLGLIFTLLGVYLWQTNTLATAGYRIEDLRQQVKDLNQQNENLNIDYVNLQSMDNLENRINQLKMVTVSQAEFVSDRETALAH